MKYYTNYIGFKKKTVKQFYSKINQIATLEILKLTIQMNLDENLGNISGHRCVINKLMDLNENIGNDHGSKCAIYMLMI